MRFQSLSLLVLCWLLFSQMTCSEESSSRTDKDDNMPVASQCIDASKINPNKACTKIYKPVCGCDDKTYANECMAEAAGLTKWKEGKCAESNACVDETKIKNDPCPDNYTPVCGCNGKTYSNKCVAQNSGVLKWEKGACPQVDGCIDETKIRNAPCPDVYSPVCGCNGKTYSNKCVAQNSGVLKWEKGACPDKSACVDESKIKNAPCPDIYSPVCGCNDKTYSNKCVAQNSGVLNWEKGACANQCIDPLKINPEMACAQIYDPVCGCNDKTYGNACEASANGVTKWEKGKCKE